MTNQTPRKMRPQSSSGMVSPAMVIGGVAIAVILFIAGVIAALSDDNDLSDEANIIFATNTPAPLPTYANGTVLAEGDTLYAVEPVAFSFAVGADNASEEQTLEACEQVTITRQGGNGEFLYLENDETYWIYASTHDAEKGWNGWLPLASLSNESPSDC